MKSGPGLVMVTLQVLSSSNTLRLKGGQRDVYNNSLLFEVLEYAGSGISMYASVHQMELGPVRVRFLHGGSVCLTCIDSFRGVRQALENAFFNSIF